MAGPQAQLDAIGGDQLLHGCTGHHGAPRMVTFGVKTGPSSTVRFMEFDVAGQLIAERRNSFMGFAFLHDFAITPYWAIVLQNVVAWCRAAMRRPNR